jgi:hypothetical protein
MSQASSNSGLTGVTPQQAREFLWRKGKVTDFLLDSNQKFLRDQLKNSKRKTHVGVFSRQTGKSYGALGIAIEELLSRKNITICYVAPRLKQAKKIVKSNFEELLKSCPPDMKPKFDRDSSSYVFPTTGSKLELYGFNAEEIESARGPKAHMIIVDECGFMSDLKYGLKSVLYPKLNSTKGAMVLISTLPRSQGHEYWDIVKQAEFKETLIKRNIYECPRYTQEDIDGFAEEVGGYDSVDFKREYLNIMITDEEHAVIPEANDEKLAVIVKQHPKPPYYDPYASMDIGGKDFTFIVLAYYDFIQGKVIIEDELLFRGKRFTTKTIASEVKEREELHWGLKKPFLRVADNNNPILLNDLSVDYGVSFLPTAKDNKFAWINQLRVMVNDERIIINPRCKNLIFHLKNATWNKSKTDYERSADGGHYDGVDALAYLIRNIAMTKNPYPSGYGMVAGDGYMRFSGGAKSKFEEHLLTMFSYKNKN